MDSLYKQYVEERTTSKILETEFGFAKYQYVDGGVYLEDIFIIKSERKTQLASAMADIIADEARLLGYETMFGSVCIDAKNSDISMKVLLAYGMIPFKCENNMVYFRKDI